jgi:hypothetical protein
MGEFIRLISKNDGFMIFNRQEWWTKLVQPSKTMIYHQFYGILSWGHISRNWYYDIECVCKLGTPHKWQLYRKHYDKQVDKMGYTLFSYSNACSFIAFRILFLFPCKWQLSPRLYIWVCPRLSTPVHLVENLKRWDIQVFLIFGRPLETRWISWVKQRLEDERLSLIHIRTNYIDWYRHRLTSNIITWFPLDVWANKIQHTNESTTSLCLHESIPAIPHHLPTAPRDKDCFKRFSSHFGMRKAIAG